MFIYIYVYIVMIERILTTLNLHKQTQVLEDFSFQMVFPNLGCVFFSGNSCIKNWAKTQSGTSEREHPGNSHDVPTLPRFLGKLGRKGAGCQVLSLTCNRQPKFPRSSTFGESTVFEDLLRELI